MKKSLASAARKSYAKFLLPSARARIASVLKVERVFFYLGGVAVKRRVIAGLFVGVFILSASGVLAGVGDTPPSPSPPILLVPSWLTDPDDRTRVQFHSFITDPTDVDQITPGNQLADPDTSFTGADFSLDSQQAANQDAWNVTAGTLGAATASAPPAGWQADGQGLGISSGLQISKDMWNESFPNQIKEYWVGMIWNAVDGAANNPPNLTVTTSGGETVTPQGFLTQSTGTGWGWISWSGVIRPQPEGEVFTWTMPSDEGEFGSGGGVVIDSIWVGTRCTPEPATIALVLAGGVACVAARRRRRKEETEE
jgi:hypothetical protein